VSSVVHILVNISVMFHGNISLRLCRARPFVTLVSFVFRNQGDIEICAYTSAGGREALKDVCNDMG